MAMAATAAAAVAVCVASPSSSSSRDCGSGGVRNAPPSFVPSLVRNRAAASAVLCSVKAGCSSSSSREGCVFGSAGHGLSSSGRPRSRDWRRQAVAEQLQASGTAEVSAEGGFSADTLFIFFEAEGALPEASVTKLTTALEAVEGVSGVNVTASSDGTATVKLTKLMNLQATEVASGLVDVLLKGGFKLHALNLGLDEEDGDDDEFYEYDVATSTEESAESEESEVSENTENTENAAS